MYIKNEMIKKIEKEIKERKITKNKLITEIGLNRNTFINMNKSEPNIETVGKIAEYLDISIDYLYGRTEDKFSHKK